MSGALAPRDAEIVAMMARKFRVGAVEAEARGGGMVTWNVTLTPEAMREIARRLDGGGFTPDMAVDARMAEARRHLRRVASQLAHMERLIDRTERWEASWLRAALWAGVMAAPAALIFHQVWEVLP